MSKLLIVISFLLALFSSSGAETGENKETAAPLSNEESALTAPPRNIEYQALGRGFVMPLGQESGLLPLTSSEANDPAWKLLAAAWNQARLLPCEAMMLLGRGEIDIYLAVLGSDTGGRAILAPLESEADFISSQIWAEYRPETGQRAVESMTGLGIFSRDDDRLYALSAAPPPTPKSVPPENAPPGAAAPSLSPAPAESKVSCMVSSLSVVNGLPIVIGVNSAKGHSQQELFAICRTLSLYLALSNQLPENGFFNPDLANLVIAGRKLNFNLPGRFCLLRANSQRQILNLLQLESKTFGLLYPLAAYAPCAELSRWQQAPGSAHLADYGLLGINLYDSQLQMVDNPGAFIKGLREEQQGQLLSTAEMDALDWSSVQMTTDAIEALGHFGTDRHAGYWAVLQPPSAAGEILGGVVGVGPVNGLAIINIRYRPLKDAKIFSGLLQEQKSMFSAFK